MANILQPNPVRALDANGDPVSGAELRFFITGTTTPVIVYSDVGLTTPHPTPMLSDAAGNYPQIYYGGNQPLRAEVQSGGNNLPGFPVDRVVQVSATQTIAAQISKRPVTGNPATDVETAINNNTERLNVIGTPSQSVQTFLGSADRAEMRQNMDLAPGAIEDLRTISGWENGDLIRHNGTNLVRTSAADAPGLLTVASMPLIVNKTANNSATLEFTEFDSAKYSHYLFTIDNLVPATDNVDLIVRTSSDGGSSYDSDASDYQYTFGFYTSTNLPSTQSSAGADSIVMTVDIGSGAGEDGFSGDLKAFGLASSTVKSRFIWDGVYHHQNGLLISLFNGGAWRNDAGTTNGVQFSMTAGNIESGSIRLFGIRGV